MSPVVRIFLTFGAVMGVLAGCGPQTQSNTESGPGNTVDANSAQVKPNGSNPNGVNPSTDSQSPVPVSAKPKHVVIVIEENRSYAEIKGSSKAPYLHQLMVQGANMTDYHGIEHPSQPNYLDIFSGSNQGVTSDNCPVDRSAPNLASELLSSGHTFAGYSEDLPSTGFKGCSNSNWLQLKKATYARKHNPWADFSNVPDSVNLPFTAFSKDYSQLPDVSFVIPNLNHDMHDGSIQAGDNWLKQNLGGYVKWAQSNDSLLVVTWDEDDKSSGNQIPAIFVGPMVKPGNYGVNYNHFSLLRTIEDIYGLPALGKSSAASPIAGIWR